jgi:hypothetical protein
MEKQNECRSGIDREKYYTVKDNYKWVIEYYALTTGKMIPSIDHQQNACQMMDCWPQNHPNEFGPPARRRSTFLLQLKSEFKGVRKPGNSPSKMNK